jgi:hypothetical protein
MLSIIPSNARRAFRCLIEECWAAEPHSLPSFQDIIAHFRRGQMLLLGCDRTAFLDQMSAEMQELLPIPFDDDVSARLDDLERLTRSGHATTDSDKFARRLSRASETQLIIRGCDLLIGSGRAGQHRP